jgi:hypothetical protein
MIFGSLERSLYKLKHDVLAFSKIKILVVENYGYLKNHNETRKFDFHSFSISFWAPNDVCFLSRH